MKENWTWHEVPLQELGQFATFRQLNQRFGRNNAVGLITRLEALQGFVTVNLLAPRNTAFWGGCVISFLLMGSDHLSKAGLQPDTQTKKLFIRDLRKASVKLSDSAANLFRGYLLYFPSNSSALPGFSEDGVSVEGDRFASFGCSESVVPRLMAYLESEVRQFGELAFFAIDNHLNLRSCDYFEETAPYHYLFRRWCLVGHDEKSRAAWLHALSSRLERALARVAAGDNLDVPLAPLHFIHPGVSFFLGTEMVGGVDEVTNPVCRSILSYRARLVRLLGWPAFYQGVCLALAPPGEGEPRRIDTYGRFEPYDVVTELEEYKREMEQRYPCLLENPLLD